MSEFLTPRIASKRGKSKGTSDMGHSLQWRKIQTVGSLPARRAGATLVEYNDRMYLYGGYPFRGSRGLWCFNPIQSRWVTVETKSRSGTLPNPRRLHSSVVHEGKMYVFGGETDKAGCCDELWVLDFESMTWTLVERSGAWPCARYGHAVTLLAGVMFMIGGARRDSIDGATAPAFLNDVWIFDTQRLQWVCLPVDGDELDPRYGHSFTLANGRLFLFGGFNSSGFLNDMWEFHYNFKDNRPSYEWSKLNLGSSVPKPRYMHTSVAVGMNFDRILIHGGKTARTDKHSIGDLWEFDTTSLRFMRIDNPNFHLKTGIMENTLYPARRHSHCGILKSGKHQTLILFGGVCDSNKMYQDMWALKTISNNEELSIDLPLDRVSDEASFVVNEMIKSSEFVGALSAMVEECARDPIQTVTHRVDTIVNHLKESVHQNSERLISFDERLTEEMARQSQSIEQSIGQFKEEQTIKTEEMKQQLSDKMVEVYEETTVKLKNVSESATVALETVNKRVDNVEDMIDQRMHHFMVEFADKQNAKIDELTGAVGDLTTHVMRIEDEFKIHKEKSEKDTEELHKKLIMEISDLYQVVNAGLDHSKKCNRSFFRSIYDLISRLDLRISDNHEVHRVFDCELSDLIGAVNDIQTQLGNIYVSNTELATGVYTCEERLDAFDEVTKVHTTAMEGLTENLNLVSGELRDSIEKNHASVTSDLKKTKMQCDTNGEQLTEHYVEYCDTHKALETLDLKHHDLVSKVNEQISDIESTANAVEAHREETKEIAKNMSAAQTSIDSIKEESVAQEGKITHLTSLLDDTIDGLQITVKGLDDVTETVVEEKAKLQVAETSLNDVVSTIETLSSDVKNTNSIVQGHMITIDQVSDKQKILGDELATVHNKISSVKDQAEAVQNIVQEQATKMTEDTQKIWDELPKFTEGIKESFKTQIEAAVNDQQKINTQDLENQKNELSRSIAELYDTVGDIPNKRKAAIEQSISAVRKGVNNRISKVEMELLDCVVDANNLIKENQEKISKIDEDVSLLKTISGVHTEKIDTLTKNDSANQIAIEAQRNDYLTFASKVNEAQELTDAQITQALEPVREQYDGALLQLSEQIENNKTENEGNHQYVNDELASLTIELGDRIAKNMERIVESASAQVATNDQLNFALGELKEMTQRHDSELNKYPEADAMHKTVNSVTSLQTNDGHLESLHAQLDEQVNKLINDSAASSQKIEQLEHGINDVVTSMKDGERDEAEKLQVVNAVREDIQFVYDEQKSLTSKMDSIAVRISSVESDALNRFMAVDAMNGQIDQFKRDIATSQQKSSEVQNRMADVESKLLDISSEQGKLEIAYEIDIKNVNTTVNDFVQSITQRLDDHTTDLSQMRPRVTECQANIDRVDRLVKSKDATAKSILDNTRAVIDNKFVEIMEALDNAVTKSAAERGVISKELSTMMDTRLTKLEKQFVTQLESLLQNIDQETPSAEGPAVLEEDNCAPVAEEIQMPQSPLKSASFTPLKQRRRKDLVNSVKGITEISRVVLDGKDALKEGTEDISCISED
ncbi:hypothetical protein PCE1_000742 [Barthelona sp. PCE]